MDWELTMKCNLDCSYCESGIYGGHDNSQSHPPLEECLRTIDFMFEYADAYMSRKINGLKYVVLNVYGGEAMHHPDIVEILQAVRDRYTKYADSWHLTITTTTNAILSQRVLKGIVPLIDEFTVSYHTDSSSKQKQQFKNNVLEIQAAKVRQKCVVLMHSEPEKFSDAQDMISWLTENGIKYLPRQLDHGPTEQFNYVEQQVIWFEGLYKRKLDHATVINNKTDLADTGRACCGGRQLCENQNRKQPVKFTRNKFQDWYCSVNHFFVYIKQVNGEVYVNKDCKMNYDGSVGPIGNLNNPQPMLDLANQPELPVIQCKKERCYCGLCAPKAQTSEEYNKIITKYFKK